MRNKNCVKCGRRFGSISRAAWFLLGEGRLWGLAAGQGSGEGKATCRGKEKLLVSLLLVYGLLLVSEYTPTVYVNNVIFT